MALMDKVSRRDFLSLAGCAVAGNCCGRALAAEAPAAQDAIPSLWSNGQLLAFSAIDGVTSYSEGLVARTTANPAGINVLLPAVAQIVFAGLGAGQIELTSDTFELPMEKGVVRGAIVDAFHLLIEGPCSVADLPPELEKTRQGSRTLLGVKAHFDASLVHRDAAALVRERQAWLQARRLPQALPERRRRTLCKALSTMKGQVCSPEGLIHRRWTTPDRWPHRDMWLWDSVFHAFGWRHVDPVLAREMVEAVFDGQQPDGRIPHQLSPFKASLVTQPPLLAFGMQHLAGTPPDLDWIERFYTPLTRYIEWDIEHRIDAGDGLAHWFIDPNPLSRSGESGMDNSPRFDAATRLNAVDLNAFLSLECAVLADFARALGRPRDEEKWEARHRSLNGLINDRLWNEEAGFYFDFDPATQKQTGIYAVSGFLPLLCGAAGARQAQRLAAQLDNPQTFATALPIASAVITPGLRQAHDMWRGPTWVNTNWLAANGFAAAGRADVARRLRELTMNEIERWYMELGSLFEFYDEFGTMPPDRLPRKGSLEPGSAYHQCVHDYGWTACLYADLVFSSQAEAPRQRSEQPA